MTVGRQSETMIVKDHKSLQQSVIERLYGRYKNTPLVDDLEAEHAAELGLRPFGKLRTQPDRFELTLRPLGLIGLS